MTNREKQKNGQIHQSIGVQIPSSVKSSKPRVLKMSLLIVSIYAFLATLTIFTYLAFINTEFRLYFFFPIIDGLIVTVICLAIAKVYHCLKNR